MSISFTRCHMHVRRVSHCDGRDGWMFEVNLVPGTVAAAKLEADAATHGLKTAPVMGRAMFFS